ncbi:MAG: DUF4240 domain-containing protein [Saprospiraceae bacterium]|nr:DUF4240 domain-containing protein [Saprospiraceae bacterium]
MTAVVKINIDELDNNFVEHLKREFAHASLEIRVHDQEDAASAFAEGDFWNLIELLDWSEEEDDAKVVEPVIQALERLPLAHIYRFADLLSEKLWYLDTKQHAQVFLDDPEEEGYLSVDDFLYARCAVVANGREYYEAVLADPSRMPVDFTFEPLLFVAMTAYQRKTGKQFIALPAFNYETYSNKKGWE